MTNTKIVWLEIKIMLEKYQSFQIYSIIIDQW